MTLKARQELAELGFGLDEEDVCEILEGLTERDSAGRLLSATTKEWMYVFKPQVGATSIYIKVILRSDCVVISFHEDSNDAQKAN